MDCIPLELEALLVERMGSAYFVAARCVCRAWNNVVTNFYRRQDTEAKRWPWMAEIKADRQLRLAHVAEWAANGHGALFGWAIERGLLDDPDIVAQAAIGRAAFACGRGDLVRQLVMKHDYVAAPGLAAAAARNGDTRLLAWLHFTHGCPIWEETLGDAIARREFDLAQWCLCHGTPRGETTLAAAAQFEGCAILEALFEHRGADTSLERSNAINAISCALVAGRLNNATWLLERQRWVDTAESAARAVADIEDDEKCIAALELLWQHGAFDCQSAKYNAILKKRPSVMAWLCKRCETNGWWDDDLLSAEEWMQLAQPALVCADSARGRSLEMLERYDDIIAPGLEYHEAICARSALTIDTPPTDSSVAFDSGFLSRVPFSKVLDFINRDCAGVVPWLLDRGIIIDDLAGITAIRKGYTSILREMVSRGLSLTSGDIVAAIERKDAKLVHWLHGRGCAWTKPNPNDARYFGEEYAYIGSHIASRFGLPMLKWATERGCPLTSSAFDGAAQAGRINVMRWLLSRGLWPQLSAAICAARAGNLRELIWLAEQGVDVVVKPCVKAAARSGQRAIVRWLPLRDSLLAACAFLTAFKAGHLAIVFDLMARGLVTPLVFERVRHKMRRILGSHPDAPWFRLFCVMQGFGPLAEDQNHHVRASGATWKKRNGFGHVHRELKVRFDIQERKPGANRTLVVSDMHDWFGIDMSRACSTGDLAGEIEAEWILYGKWYGLVEDARSRRMAGRVGSSSPTTTSL